MKFPKHVMSNEVCTGCGACYELCPVDAISMGFDEEGFLKPNILFDVCTNCEKCVTNCPSIHPQYENSKYPKCYAAYAEDNIRGSSTSGGVFFCLAKYVLEHNGVVFGAAFTEDFFVKHIAVKKITELHRICHTKYVQSNTANTFSEAKNYLEQGLIVLYSGCPCQIAGIKAYLGKNYENLILVDILCMQVPPAPLFRRYLEETYSGLSNVIGVEFRDKAQGWTAKNLTVITKEKVATLSDYPLGWMTECKTKEFSDRIVYQRDARYDAYLSIFYRKLTMNSVCANCEFATYPRQGDISLGDFWGIRHHDKAFDNNGTNLVLLNNQKGQKYFGKIKNTLQKCEKKPIRYIGKNRVQGKLELYEYRARLYELLQKTSIEKAVKQCISETYEIGIVGGWATPNYGGSLTYYALYHILNDMGYSTILITHPYRIPWDTIIRAMKYEKFPYPQYAFKPAPHTVTELKQYNKLCDTFVVGSDQLYNYRLYSAMDRFVDLSWVYDNKRKIAYAASFGIDDFYGPEDERARLQYFLSKYDFFSVREESGVLLAKNKFTRTAEWVLDPVFLCDTRHYDELICDCNDPPSQEPYLFSYMLDIDTERELILHHFSEKLGISVCAIADALSNNIDSQKRWGIYTIPDASNNQLLAYIKCADYIVTDSFHGMCFCIIFRKQFSVISNSRRGKTRMDSLAKLLGLEDRIIERISEEVICAQLFTKIDFERISLKLEEEKTRCFNWLRGAITEDIGPKALSEYDILDMRMDAYQVSFRDKLCQKVKKGIKCLQEHGIVYTGKLILKKIIQKLK